jgi:hypothetical protein
MDVGNVINLSCVLSASKEVALLEEQKKLVCSMLKQTVLTPEGVLIVQAHSDAGDATAAFVLTLSISAENLQQLSLQWFGV